ncbi:MAG: methyltransferase domain-containing protein [Opitutales bacterium]|nr:methyltransferase domain-containing protein [Opitutales bacterium]MCH8540007.1 methyltransferase domain-containing protein [Opitutales bacterium]
MANKNSPAELSPAIGQPAWWQREDLFYDRVGRLFFGGVDLASVATEQGTPLYVYSGQRIEWKVRELRRAMATIGCPTRLLYALKANRHPEVMKALWELGVGLDVCSPGEVDYALRHGFTFDQLSFTAGCLDQKDYESLAQWPDLWVNLDSLTALRRFGELCPGRRVGLRLNPATGLGYQKNELVRYASAKPTKFGIFVDRLEEALALAENYRLKIRGLHCHAGSGFLASQMEELDHLLETLSSLAKRVPGLEQLNLGGGLGVPLTEEDQPLDLEDWACRVRKYFADSGLTLLWEPGDYLVKDAGVLVAEVTQVEDKGGVRFLGLNAGFNIHPEPAFYKLPLEPVPCLVRAGAPEVVTIVGNINEALDVWAADFSLPPVEEGDALALLNAGAYGASMASAHCLRDTLKEIFVPSAETDRLDALNRDSWESLYASTSESVWGHEPMPFLEEFRDKVTEALVEPVRLLDAGTGEGRNIPFLLRLGEAEVVALDAANAALQKIPPHLKAQSFLREGLLHATGLPSGYFDFILLLDVAETLPDLSRVLTELWRILKPGGLLLCNFAAEEDGVAGIDMNPVHSEQGFLYQGRYFFRFCSAKEAETTMRAAGFTVRESRLCSWEEAPHPGFREEEHLHRSHVLLVQRPLAV